MFPINDMFDAVLVGGFLFGLLFTVASFALGFADLGADHGDVGHDFGHDTGHDIGHDGDGGAGWQSLFNLSSLLAFITWFSGITYIARNGLELSLLLAIPIGLVFGTGAAWLISWLLFTVLRRNSGELDPRDFRLEGTLGRVSSTIRENGVGEVIFEQNGYRHAVAARTDQPLVIARNTEVIILRNERGVAIVEPFDDLMRERDPQRLTIER